MAYAAAEVIGNSLAVSGVAGPAGVAVTTAAKTASALDEVISRGVTERQMKQAWEAYRKCLKNRADNLGSTTNRKALLECFQNNPTLAKYSMYYAAVEMSDPIAKEGLQAAGLSEETLLGADAHKTVRYLELKWDKDPKCYKRVEPKKDWMADDKYELTLSAWVGNKVSARKAEKLDESNMKSPEIDGILVHLETHEKEATQAKKDYDDATKTYMEKWVALRPLNEKFEANEVDFVTDAQQLCSEIQQEHNSGKEALGQTEIDEKEFVRRTDKLLKKAGKRLAAARSARDFAKDCLEGVEACQTKLGELRQKMGAWRTAAELVGNEAAALEQAFNSYGRTLPGNSEFLDYVDCLSSVTQECNQEFQGAPGQCDIDTSQLQPHDGKLDALKNAADSYYPQVAKAADEALVELSESLMDDMKEHAEAFEEVMDELN